MIKELRIGNLVMYQGEIHEVEAIDDEGNVSIGVISFEGLTVDDIEPVPVTDDLLLSFGFKKKPNPNNTPSYCFYKDRIRWVIYSLFKKKYHLGIDGFTPELKHAHRLQNIYMDLMEKELKIEK